MLTSAALDAVCGHITENAGYAICHTADGAEHRAEFIAVSQSSQHEVQATLYLEKAWGGEVVQVDFMSRDGEVWAEDVVSVVFSENQDRVLYGITFSIREG